MYGKLILWTNKRGKLGSSLGYSDIVGEDSVAAKDYICRMFHCSCEEDAGLIPVLPEYFDEEASGHEHEALIAKDLKRLKLILIKNLNSQFSKRQLLMH